MEKKDVVAKLNHLRVAPRKAMLVVDLIRGKSIKEALAVLDLANKKSVLPVKKLLNSAIANAKNNFHLSEENLYISKIVVNQGPKLKRWIARSRGQANEIQKKTSHIVLVLSEKKSKSPKERKIDKGDKKQIKNKKKLNK